MASIKIFGFGGRLRAEYNDITNAEVKRLHEEYRDDDSIYGIETNYDYD